MKRMIISVTEISRGDKNMKRYIKASNDDQR